MDDHLKLLLQRLGRAINKSLSQSDEIALIMTDIRDYGFGMILVLEAKVSPLTELKKIPPQSDDKSEGSMTTAEPSFTSQDQAFLHALKIRVEE